MVTTKILGILLAGALLLQPLLLGTAVAAAETGARAGLPHPGWQTPFAATPARSVGSAGASLDELAGDDTQTPGASAAAAEPAKLQPIRLPDFARGHGYLPNPFRPYQPAEVPAAELNNTPRVGQLMREGKLYLSLADALALAMENNLDVAVQRYSPLMADTDILRAQAGAPPRGTRGSVIGQTPILVTPTTTGGAATGSFDPVFTATFMNEHSAFPVTSFVTRVVQGLTAVKVNTFTANFSYAQTFHTGTQFTLNLNNNRQTNVQNTLNPQVSSNFNLQISQHLLNGFGFAHNNRGIRVAKNNREVSDLVFKQQIIVTATQVQNQYWDLVSTVEAVRVAERSLQVAEKLYNDNKRQVEIGTLAPIEVVRAEAEVAARRQDLIVAQTNLQQLSTSMKSLILRNIADSAILSAEVVPTDRIQVPPVEPVVPVQDQIAQALSSRPELAQSRIDLTNRDINVRATKSAMLPTLDAFAFWAGRGVAGVDRDPRTGQVVTSNLTGGLGRAYTNLWGSDYPDYALGLQLSIPIRNRSAQADMALALLDRRQADLRLRQMENQVRVEVTNALIALQQNRARIDAAQKQRELAERSLDAEQKKFQLGASTIFLVIQAQRDLTSALSAEVTALGVYMKARVEMERATGQTIFRNNISLDEAYQGQVTKLPVALPVTKRD